VSATATHDGRFSSEETLVKIQDLTSIGCSAGQIRLHLGLTVPAQTLYIARRLQLRQCRRNQAAELKEQIQTYKDCDTYLLRDDHCLAGCSLFYGLLAGSRFCRDTLIMDGTLCTNRCRVPILVIFGRHEHTPNQLLAFAVTPDRRTHAFAAFLG
jgi:hypothetical protein